MDKGLKWHYDEHADVLYITVGTPQVGIVTQEEDEDDGVLIRRNPDTNEIVGITIFNFRTAFLKEPKSLPVGLCPA